MYHTEIDLCKVCKSPLKAIENKEIISICFLFFPHPLYHLQSYLISLGHSSNMKSSVILHNRIGKKIHKN